MDKRKLVADLKMNSSEISKKALERQLEMVPEIRKRYSEYQMEKAIQDFNYHIQFLSEAVLLESPILFANYLLWLKELLSSLKLPENDLKMSVLCLSDIMKERYPEEFNSIINLIIEEGIKILESKSLFTE